MCTLSLFHALLKLLFLTRLRARIRATVAGTFEKLKHWVWPGTEKEIFWAREPAFRGVTFPIVSSPWRKEKRFSSRTCSPLGHFFNNQSLSEISCSLEYFLVYFLPIHYLNQFYSVFYIRNTNTVFETHAIKLPTQTDGWIFTKNFKIQTRSTSKLVTAHHWSQKFQKLK